MGEARAIGFALGLLLVSSGPAGAPLHAGSEPVQPLASTPCMLAPASIALGCATASTDWLDASLLARDPLAAPRTEADRGGAASLVAEQLDDGPELAQVPEPLPLFGLALGLAVLAVSRHVHSG